MTKDDADVIMRMVREAKELGCDEVVIGVNRFSWPRAQPQRRDMAPREPRPAKPPTEAEMRAAHRARIMGDRDG